MLYTERVNYISLGRFKIVTLLFFILVFGLIFQPSSALAAEGEINAFVFCEQVPSEQYSDCTTCMGANTGSEKAAEKLYTSVGCIGLGDAGLVKDLVRLLLGIGGGVALLSILAAAFLITTSQGDTNRVKQARELMTSAVMGLFFMIFSVTILQFGGVTILRIPGLASSGTGSNDGAPPIATQEPVPSPVTEPGEPETPTPDPDAEILDELRNNSDLANLQNCASFSQSPEGFDGNLVNTQLLCTGGASCGGFASQLVTGMDIVSGNNRCSSPMNVSSLVLQHYQAQLNALVPVEYQDAYVLEISESNYPSVVIHYRPNSARAEAYLTHVKPILDAYHDSEPSLQLSYTFFGIIEYNGVTQVVDTTTPLFGSFLPGR